MENRYNFIPFASVSNEIFETEKEFANYIDRGIALKFTNFTRKLCEIEIQLMKLEKKNERLEQNIIDLKYGRSEQMIKCQNKKIEALEYDILLLKQVIAKK
jgi:cell division protein FtsB